MRGLVAETIDELFLGDQTAFAHLRRVMGRRTVRIMVGDESVDVHFRGELASVVRSGRGKATNLGLTSWSTVIDILAGRLDTFDAILEDRIRVFGSPSGVEMMLVAIEIVLQASTYLPRLLDLGNRVGKHHASDIAQRAVVQRIGWYPFEIGDEEHAALGALRLLPTPGSKA